MRKRRNFLLFFIYSFLLNCPTTEEQMLYFTIFCLFRHSFIIKTKPMPGIITPKNGSLITEKSVLCVVDRGIEPLCQD